MKTPINDGGPAFARAGYYDPDAPCASSDFSKGMSLRDWFAGMALPKVYARSHGTPSDVAAECYQLADAMIAEREKGKA